MTTAYKVFTHDFRSPIQGGDPVWDGSVPFSLPRVKVDSTNSPCGAGWNACHNLRDALRIGGLWPSGRPSVVARVEIAGALLRGDKVRCAEMDIVEILSENEVRVGVSELSGAFGIHAGDMADSQMAWRRALSRPMREECAVKNGLCIALETRGLQWSLRQFDTAWDAWAAWAARPAWDAWDAWAAWASRDAWDAWPARPARPAWDAWPARPAWDARDARAARDACDALTFQFSALSGWVDGDPMLLTAGIREAYASGLAIAIPTGSNELGFAMVEEGGAK